MLWQTHRIGTPADFLMLVLPVTNFDAYFGNGTFSKKWLPKEFDFVIIRDSQSNGVSRYTLHEKLIGSRIFVFRKNDKKSKFDIYFFIFLTLFIPFYKALSVLWDS